MWFCCWAGPAKPSFLDSCATASVGCTVPSDYELQAQSPVTSRGISLQDILLSALTRRRQMYSESDPDLNATPSIRADAARNTRAFIQQLGSQDSMGSLLLTSWCAKQFLAFKTLWVQAATTNKLPCTDTGLTLHEMYLVQYLKHDSAASRWGPSAACLGLKAAQGSHNSSHSHPTHRFAQQGSQQAASPFAASNASSDAHTLDNSWTEWKNFAEPPDCPVASSLQWAAAAGCSSHDSSQSSRADSCAP